MAEPTASVLRFEQARAVVEQHAASVAPKPEPPKADVPTETELKIER